MPAAISIPLIAAGVGGTAAVIGAKTQAGATEDAAGLQNQFNNRALDVAQATQDWQKQQYSNYINQQRPQYLAQLQPFQQAGVQAGNTLSSLLARSPYANPGQAPQQFNLPASSIGNLAAK